MAIVNGATPGGAKVTNSTPDSGDYALAVRLVGGGSSGTQYTEDAAAAADPVGTAVNLIRKDTPASITGTDGDNVAQRGTNYGAGYVQVVTSAGSFVDTFGGGTQYTEGDTDASITGTAMLMEGAANTLLTVPGTTADGLLVNLGGNNDVTVTGSVAVTNAALSVVGGGVEATALRVTVASDSTGVLSVDDNGGSITVDGTVAITGAVDTELPAAASLTDNFANPTTTNVAAMGMVWDGATWDRAAGTSADGTLVNLGTNNDVTVTSGAITETNSAAIAASLSVLDDWDETDRAKVNVIAGQVGIAGGTGVDGATVPRVTLATNVGLPAGTSVIGKVGHDITGIGHGVTVVTTAGTDVALAGSTSCKRVVIQAQTDNTTGIAVGGSGVDATIATGTGIFLNPGDAFELETDNLADVFVDSLTNGEGVRYTYFT